jgi:hypothetical protein
MEDRHQRALVTAGVPKTGRIECKSALPGSYDGRTVFVDISSFANSVGGDLVYGVGERNGVPVALPGVPIPNPDWEILRLEVTVWGGFDPRREGVEGSEASVSPLALDLEGANQAGPGFLVYEPSG